MYVRTVFGERKRGRCPLFRGVFKSFTVYCAVHTEKPALFEKCT